MDKQQAEHALSIIRDVIENTRDDLIARNWGAIWISHSFINPLGAFCGAYIVARELPLYWFAAPLLGVALLNILAVVLLVRRDTGVRSYVEWQLWGIWISFFIFTVFVLAVLQLAGAEAKLFAPLFAMNCGIAFAMMGLVFYRHFLIVAAMFLIGMLAAAALPSVQWYIVGVAWWAATFFPGIYAFLEMRKRNQDERRTKLL